MKLPLQGHRSTIDGPVREVFFQGICGSLDYWATKMDTTGFEKESRPSTLASPMDRVAGALVDFALFLPVLVAHLVLLVNYVDGVKGRPEWSPSWKFDAIHVLLFLIALIPTLISGFLVMKRGYSIGKRLLWIRVVRTDGTAVGFVRGVFLRSWVVVTLLFTFPRAWLCYWLVNLLLTVLRRDRRCLHDLALGTKVVKV
jgi:uncharacterized RDD family membrane protein YckC